MTTVGEVNLMTIDGFITRDAEEIPINEVK